MTIRTVQLFVNPRPSWVTRRRIDALRRAFERKGVAVLVTASVSGRLEIDPRADHVCAAGGDGTVRHVVDALRRSGRDISVSAFPAGTINLLARECGYPRSPEGFVRRVLEPSAPSPHYLAMTGDTPMLICASVGPDSYAIEALSPRLKTVFGRLAYLVAFCGLLVRWPRTPITLWCDDRRLDCEAVYIAKGRYFAGSWSFAPEASVRDPALSVVAIRHVTRRRFAAFFGALVFRRPVDALEGVQRVACTRVRIESDVPAPFQADGDTVGRLPVSVEVDPVPMDFI